MNEFKPELGIYPQTLFSTKEDYELFKARRKEILKRHLWRLERNEKRFVCRACGRVLEGTADREERRSARSSECPGKKTKDIMEPIDVWARWPSATAHMICESLGYATPSTAASIILDALNGRENWCEWIHACHQCNPMRPLKASIETRQYHKGYMAEYRQGLHLVIVALVTEKEPVFASWF